jgi:hypothetical protein
MESLWQIHRSCQVRLGVLALSAMPDRITIETMTLLIFLILVSLARYHSRDFGITPQPALKCTDRHALWTEASPTASVVLFWISTQNTVLPAYNGSKALDILEEKVC